MDWNKRVAGLLHEDDASFTDENKSQSSFIVHDGIPKDVAFMVEGRRIEAHKFVLSMKSNVFRNTLYWSQGLVERNINDSEGIIGTQEESTLSSSPFIQSSQIVRRDLWSHPVVVVDVKGRIFELMIKFIYKGKLDNNLDLGTLHELIDAAERYEVEGLAKACRKQVNKNKGGKDYHSNKKTMMTKVRIRKSDKEAPRTQEDFSGNGNVKFPQMFDDEECRLRIVSTESLADKTIPIKIVSPELNNNNTSWTLKTSSISNVEMKVRVEKDEAGERKTGEIKVPVKKEQELEIKKTVPLSQRPCPASVKRKLLLGTTMLSCSTEKTFKPNVIIDANHKKQAANKSSEKKKKCPVIPDSSKVPPGKSKPLAFDGVTEKVNSITEGGINDIKVVVTGNEECRVKKSYAQLIKNLIVHTAMNGERKRLCMISWNNLDIAEAYEKNRGEKFQKIIVPHLQEFNLSLNLKSMANPDQLKDFLRNMNIEEYLFFICATDIDAQFVNYLFRDRIVNVTVNGRIILKAVPEDASLTLGFTSRAKDIVENLNNKIVMRKLAIGNCDFPQIITNFVTGLRKVVISNCFVGKLKSLRSLLKSANKLTHLAIVNVRLPMKTSLVLHLNEETFGACEYLKKLVICDALLVIPKTQKDRVRFPVLEKLVLGDVMFEHGDFVESIATVFPRLKEVVIFGSSCMKVKKEIYDAFKGLKFMESIEIWNFEKELLLSSSCRRHDGEVSRMNKSLFESSFSSSSSLRICQLQNFKTIKEDEGEWKVEKLLMVNKRSHLFIELQQDLFFCDLEAYKDHLDPTIESSLD